jgi:hypothetical protein
VAGPQLLVLLLELLGQVSGTINYIKSENMTYPSCPRDFNGRTCQKKLQDQDNNNW